MDALFIPQEIAIPMAFKKDYRDSERDKESDNSLNRALLEKETVKSWNEITNINADVIIILVIAMGVIPVWILDWIIMFS